MSDMYNASHHIGHLHETDANLNSIEKAKCQLHRPHLA